MAAMGTAHIKVVPEIDAADLDAAMVEAIAQRVAEINRRPKLKLAKSVVIDGDAGTVTIDGTPLGYFIAEGGPVIDHARGAGGLAIVNIRVLAERAKYTGPAL